MVIQVQGNEQEPPAAGRGSPRVVGATAGRMATVVSPAALPDRTSGDAYPDPHMHRYRDRSGMLHLPNATTAHTLFSGHARERGMARAAGASRDYAGLIREVAERYGVGAALVKAVIRAESAFDPLAISPKGALGLMQLMPETAALHGVSDTFAPAENIEGGVKHLRMLLDQYGGNVRLALAAYNAGSQAVEAAGNQVPPYRETRHYVRRVLSYRRAYLRENPPLGIRGRR